MSNKVFLILEYKSEGTNVWAEVKAFTSANERNKAFEKYFNLDAEKVDVEVSKRTYKSKKVVDENPQPLPWEDDDKPAGYGTQS